MKVTLFICCVVSVLAELSWAQIGESPVQCFRRYGGKVTQQSFVGDAKQVVLQSDDWRVSCLFVKNGAEFFVFRKAGSLSEAEAQSLLQRHGTDLSEALGTRCHQRVGNKMLEAVRWTLPDRIAIFNPLRNSVTLCRGAFADALAAGGYEAADGVRDFTEISRQLDSSSPLTSGEVAVMEAAFAAEAASRKSEKTALDAAIAARKAALSALEAQENSLQAQAQALDSQRSSIFARDPHGSRNERQALENSRVRILRARDDVAKEARNLRGEISSLLNEQRTTGTRSE